MTEEIKPYLAKTRFKVLSERSLVILWKEFSDIQHASYLIVDPMSVKRFKKWIATGKDDEAWS